jgi:glucan biosynthesis protein C
MSSAARFHALDALRGVMMLLGVVFHGALSYGPPRGGGWPVHDPPGHVAFTVLSVYLHIFRMPVFFLVAGFFAALLFLDRGPRDFLKNRAARVLLPLLLFWLPLALSMSSGAWSSQTLLNQRDFHSYPELLAAMTSDASFFHLWFLYDLILFYIASLAFTRLANPPWLDRLFHAWIHSPFRAIIFALICLPLVAGAPAGYLRLNSGLVPPIPNLVTYGFFFFFGWQLYRQREHLTALQRGAWLHLIAAILLALPYLRLLRTILNPSGTASPRQHWIACLLGVLALAGFTFGFLGLFLRYFQRFQPVVRYLADASYWTYLVHLPLLFWITGPVALAPVPLPLRFLLQQILTLGLCFLSYDLLVRNTVLGRLLSGRTYPRGLPAAA